MRVNVVHTVEVTEPATQQGEYTKENLGKSYRVACLYEIEHKPVVRIVNRGRHLRYMVKK